MRTIQKIALLAACASGFSYAGTDYFFVANQPVSNISGRTIFNASTYPTTGYDKIIFSVDNPTGDPNGQPANQTGIPISGWNVGDFSGLPVPTPEQNYQRGLAGTSYGGTAVSMHDVLEGGVLSPRFGAMLNAYGLTWTQARDANGNLLYLPNGKPKPHHTNISSANLDYAPSGSVVHKPFSRGPSSVFRYSMMLQAPSVTAVGDARAQLGVNFTLVDTTDPSGRYIWYQTYALDYPTGDETYVPKQSISWDKATASFVINSSFKDGTTYSTKDPASSYSMTQPWTGWKWFGYSVSYNQILSAINDVNAQVLASAECQPATYDASKCRPFNTNPGVYKLGLIYVGAEFARSSPDAAGYLGYSSYGWWAYTDY